VDFLLLKTIYITNKNVIFNMSKKVIISENTLKKIVANQMLNEGDLTKTEIVNIVRDTVKNDTQTKKDIEKKVKELVANSVNTLFKTLWQRRNFYEDEIKK
jgi:polyhydroxyalkanoate synthesis regulator phasin